LGEEEAVLEDEERGAVAVPVPEATRGRRRGDFVSEYFSLF